MGEWYFQKVDGAVCTCMVVSVTWEVHVYQGEGEQVSVCM